MKSRHKKLFSYISPVFYTELAQSYASLAFMSSIDKFETKCRLLQSCKYHLNKGRNIDLTSSNLLEMTLLYKIGKYDRCSGILNRLELTLNRKPISIRVCDIKSSFTVTPM